ncbi:MULTISPECIES: proteasome ATPase [Mycolicibacterium]|jgi:proteasome-associated ATPase|uniref:Proteasome-associated ATPase n=2 Tax=Mycolicibacterium TaxID=1866885 RepID=ARC_MYCVP|nr:MULTISPECIES: proteasome ATPase [Mycolicibacterium]A1TAQ3.1 RecName: Full=Proteasome-associated ATPase; AltName: Full=AAA ATPase forming ring-shaped complexes; Short=ARC; AltName: Full=Mycobacterial proteasome ATPase [Mycolicibacterium vanbaalenii PYR-1]ABM14253.1 Vesicle-fusing ATPase [Mycolicibacterium vanbaalenii PYR-1]MCV7128862.1 proteasome ATPase [Mycolicibacterium vanbaalenii PYR-1]MDN4519923.1 proteasome ATPase [Mycolicibacterium austroafricanum]MDW5613115.1 proteasome ATPase [Mycol
MSESERSEASEVFGTSPDSRLSSEDAAELEQLRREAAILREQLEDAGGLATSARAARDVHQLEARIDSLAARNAKLMDTLKEARQQLLALREEVDRLGQPPSGYGVLLSVQDDETVDVFTSGRKMRLTCSPNIETKELKKGQTVRLNEALTVVEAGHFESVGEISTLREILSDGHRALVVGHADEERIVWLAEPLVAAEHLPEGSYADEDDLTDDRPRKLRPGDSLLVDTKAGYAFERIPKAEVEDLVLEEVPDVSYNDIGGLGRQIEQIRDAVELPFLHKELYREYSLRPPKGVLLYGPPGCGKTLIAKAVANSLAKKMAEVRGDDAREAKSYFLNIKGPELLNKFVGETERHIRLIFQRAREKASEGTPVIVFFDEMDSIFRTRGTGVSSDVETTVVPQLLSEIDGVEGLENVIVIGASNREDMIDPAILRPGRLDVKIKIERPDAESAQDIFSKYLTEELPIHDDDLAEFSGDRSLTIKAMIEKVVDRMYAEIDDNRFLEVTYANGDKEVMYFKDFNSGAMIQNVVDRAKKNAIKAVLETGQRGLRIQHLLDSIIDEFAENEDLPNTTNPDDWARISGKKGERIVYIRTLVTGKSSSASRAIDTESNLGQYL